MRFVAVILAAVVAASPAESAREQKLPPGAMHGVAHRLDQYPTLALATPAERAFARQLWIELRRVAMQWRPPTRAAAAGFRVERPRRRPHQRAIFIMHAPRRDGVRRALMTLPPGRPDTLIYADVPRRPLVLIGVMYAMPRGVRGPTPGGPITRWHSHIVCARGNRRGIRPRRDGSCPRGMKKRIGSEMMHVWFTNDLRSAYAIHAPRRELCTARLLPPSRCGAHARHDHDD